MKLASVKELLMATDAFLACSTAENRARLETAERVVKGFLFATELAPVALAMRAMVECPVPLRLTEQELALLPSVGEIEGLPLWKMRLRLPTGELVTQIVLDASEGEPSTTIGVEVVEPVRQFEPRPAASRPRASSGQPALRLRILFACSAHELRSYRDILKVVKGWGRSTVHQAIREMDGPDIALIQGVYRPVNPRGFEITPLAERILGTVTSTACMSINGIVRALAAAGLGARKRDVHTEVAAMFADGRLTRMNGVICATVHTPTVHADERTSLATDAATSRDGGHPLHEEDP